MPEAALRDLVLDTAPGDTTLRDTVPVLPALHPVLPGGLRPGSVVGLDGLGAASLGLALAAGVSVHGGEDGTGGWCGVVGLPGFGVAAAAGMGAAPERLLLVDEPGDRWPDVVAALCEAVDLVLLCPPERPGAAAVRRLSALARKHGCVLTLTGAFARNWPGTRLRLRLDDVAWDGLADGHGRLTGRRVQIVAEGRDAPGPGRRARVWLPAPDGTVKPVETARPPLELVPEPPADGPVADGGPVHRRPSGALPHAGVPVEEGIA
ncbi:hypothetical protein [Spirillospora sp. NPDC048819]|uniref:hypothetical protein n=1 Tax=Spirillospora sp. NPDC048819 TaxID=3155268 RepID=UPI0033F3BE16